MGGRGAQQEIQFLYAIASCKTEGNGSPPKEPGEGGRDHAQRAQHWAWHRQHSLTAVLQLPLQSSRARDLTASSQPESRDTSPSEGPGGSADPSPDLQQGATKAV